MVCGVSKLLPKSQITNIIQWKDQLPHWAVRPTTSFPQVPNILEDDRDSSSAKNSDADDNEFSLTENDYLEDIDKTLTKM